MGRHNSSPTSSKPTSNLTQDMGKIKKPGTKQAAGKPRAGKGKARLAQEIDNHLTQSTIAVEIERPVTKRAVTKSRGGKGKTRTEPTEEVGPRECFTRELLENGDINEILNTAVPEEERKDLSRQIPTVFLKPHLPVIGGTDMAMGWKFYDAKENSPLHYCKSNHRAESLEEHGL